MSAVLSTGHKPQGDRVHEEVAMGGGQVHAAGLYIQDERDFLIWLCCPSFFPQTCTSSSIHKDEDILLWDLEPRLRAQSL